MIDHSLTPTARRAPKIASSAGRGFAPIRLMPEFRRMSASDGGTICRTPQYYELTLGGQTAYFFKTREREN
jgi:hypothetical protein